MRVNLIMRRKKKKLTQEQMAKMVGIARSTYNSYELGTRIPSLENAIKIKQILNYKNDDLFFLKENDAESDKVKEGI